ncbi:tyrosine-type recombinase/integrase [Streptomyces sp. NBC_01077]|uniref:tyrosine-type recombinase/integrase n=1 Tax=Streptomyces sp. NBC_01077 TaxID=2903746 RepID=UPI0038635E1D
MPTGPTTRRRSRTACAPSRSTPRPRHCGSPGARPSSRNASSGPERRRGSTADGSGPTRTARRFTPTGSAGGSIGLVELSGLPPIRLHDTRHLSATLALLGKADIKVVQERLGHSSRQITSDTYTSVLPQLLTAEAESTSAVVPRSKQPSPNLVEEKGSVSRSKAKKPEPGRDQSPGAEDTAVRSNVTRDTAAGGPNEGTERAA